MFCLFSAHAWAHEQISIANLYQVETEILQETRAFSVYLPPSDQTDQNRLNPVIYVLDGDKSRLLATSGVVEALNTSTVENQIEQFIIVGVPETNRNRDFTPPADDLISKGIGLAQIHSGGGANYFLGLLQKELMPMMQAIFRSKYR